MGKYDVEFKPNAVKKILAGQSVASVSRELGIAESLPHKREKAKLETGSGLEKENLDAQAESFFSRFKAELVENGIFESVEDAGSEVFSYIEGYYNRIRLHSGLNYKSPVEFQKRLETKNIRSSESFVCGKT